MFLLGLADDVLLQNVAFLDLVDLGNTSDVDVAEPVDQIFLAYTDLGDTGCELEPHLVAFGDRRDRLIEGCCGADDCFVDVIVLVLLAADDLLEFFFVQFFAIHGSSSVLFGVFSLDTCIYECMQKMATDLRKKSPEAPSGTSGADR